MQPGSPCHRATAVVPACLVLANLCMSCWAHLPAHGRTLHLEAPSASPPLVHMWRCLSVPVPLQLQRRWHVHLNLTAAALAVRCTSWRPSR